MEFIISESDRHLKLYLSFEELTTNSVSTVFVIQCFLCCADMLETWDISCQRVAFICPVPSATMDLWHISTFFSLFYHFSAAFFCCSFLMQNLFSFSRKKTPWHFMLHQFIYFTIQSFIPQIFFYVCISF